MPIITFLHIFKLQLYTIEELYRWRFLQKFGEANVFYARQMRA
jgi:hypothetical protein